MHAAEDLIRQGRTARFEGRTEEALGLYQAAAELFQNENDDLRWAQSMRYVAAIEVELKRGEDARRDIDAVLAMYSARTVFIPQQSEVFEVANATRVSALTAELCGEVERSKTLWKEAADLFAEARLLEGTIEATREAAMHAKETHTPEYTDDREEPVATGLMDMPEPEAPLEERESQDAPASEGNAG